MKISYQDLWVEKKVDNKFEIGFTQECLENKLVECFHVLPADETKSKTNSPLLVLETNDGLQSIKAPINGKIIFFNDKARNFPDRLTTKDVILIVKSEEVSTEKKDRAPLQPTWAGFANIIVDDPQG